MNENLEKAAAAQLTKFVLWGWNRNKFQRNAKITKSLESGTCTAQELAKYIRSTGATPYVKIAWLLDVLAPVKKAKIKKEAA